MPTGIEIRFSRVRRFLLISGASVLGFWAPIAYAEGASTGSIKINVSELRNDKGEVRVALFNDAGKFDRSKNTNDQSFRAFIAPVSAGKAQCTFENLPYGEYAIKFFHDEDRSGTFYSNFIGIPKVEFGFSNDARGHFGPAKYSDAKFVLNKPSLDLSLRATHF